MTELERETWKLHGKPKNNNKGGQGNRIKKKVNGKPSKKVRAIKVQ